MDSFLINAKGIEASELSGWSVTQFPVLFLLPVPPQHEPALFAELGLTDLN